MAFFCPNCGTQNSDEDKFCQACGTKLETGAAEAEPVMQQADPQPVPMEGDGFNEFVEPAADTQNTQYSADFVYQDPAAAVPQATTAKKGNAVPIIIGVAAVAGIGVVAAIVLSLNRYTKIDAKDLFDIEFAGPDGYGVCYAQLDIDPNFARSEYGVYMEDYSLTKMGDEFTAEKPEYSNYFAEERKKLEKAYPKKSKSEAEELRDALLDVDKKEGAFTLTCEPSKSSGLSNGDTVTIEVVYDEDDLKDSRIKLENTTFEIEVKGLEKAETLDAFAGVEPEFKGVDGDGDIVYDSLSGDYPFIYYSLEGSSYDHYNGEEITVVAELGLYGSDINYFDEEDKSKGFWFRYDGKLYVWEYENTYPTKKYTVSGLTELNELDPADEIEITYEGAAPFLDIKVDVKSDSKYADKLLVSLEDDYYDRYDIGDKVTIKVYGYSSLQDMGVKLKGVGSDGYAYVEFTVGDNVPTYVKYADAVAANEAMNDMFKNAETEFKQKIQNSRSISGSTYDTSLSLDDKCEKVNKMKVLSTYHIMNEITDYSSISYNTAINSIRRIYKVTLRTSGGEETIYAVLSLDNVISQNGEFTTTAEKAKFDVYATKDEAYAAVEGLSGYTVSALAVADSSSEAPAESSSAEEDSAAPEESAAAEESAEAEESADDSAEDSAAS